LIEVDDDVCEDSEEIEGHESEDCPVLCPGGEEPFYLEAADSVSFFVSYDFGTLVL
jgi:hypothetical protein